VAHAGEPNRARAAKSPIDSIMEPAVKGVAHEARHPFRELEERATERSIDEEVRAFCEDFADEAHVFVQPVQEQFLEGVRRPPRGAQVGREVPDYPFAHLLAFSPQAAGGSLPSDRLDESFKGHLAEEFKTAPRKGCEFNVTRGAIPSGGAPHLPRGPWLHFVHEALPHQAYQMVSDGRSVESELSREIGYGPFTNRYRLQKLDSSPAA